MIHGNYNFVSHMAYLQTYSQHYALFLLARVRVGRLFLMLSSSAVYRSNHFEIALLVQSVLMILAQVRNPQLTIIFS